MNQHNPGHDDLRKIKGIGPVRQKWFGDALGVYTYRQLAALSIAEISNKLKADGMIPSPSEIETWIGQAGELMTEAAAHEAAEPVLEVMANKDTEQNRGKAAPASKETAIPAGSGIWKPFASFVVEYQSIAAADQNVELRTSVHYMEKGIGATWSGIERDQVCEWMQQQADVPETKSSAPVETTEDTAMVAKLEARQVSVRQFPDYASTIVLKDAERPFIAHVQHDKPLSVEVTFEDIAKDGPDITSIRRDYNVHCHLHNLTTGAAKQLVTMKLDSQQNGDRPNYKAWLREISLEPGLYDLGILVSGTNPLRTDYVELPKLNVL